MPACWRERASDWPDARRKPRRVEPAKRVLEVPREPALPEPPTRGRAAEREKRKVPAVPINFFDGSRAVEDASRERTWFRFPMEVFPGRTLEGFHERDDTSFCLRMDEILSAREETAMSSLVTGGHSGSLLENGHAVRGSECRLPRWRIWK